MNLGLWLERTARRAPARPALFLGEEMVSDYAGFDARSRSVAAWLREQGVTPGDRVALYMGNRPDYLPLIYGVWYAGAAAVPINAKLHGREAAFILEDSGAKVVFSAGEQADALRDAGIAAALVTDLEPVYAAAPVDRIEERDADDLAWLFYTSGTTGRPKGVIITHGMLMAMALSYTADVDPVSPEDTALYAAPMSHGAGLYNIMHVVAGARHLCPPSGGFAPTEILDLAASFGRVHMFAAPTMVKRLTDFAHASGQSGEGLRTIVYGGGPMYLADILEAVAHFGDIFVQIYGQGECPMSISALRREDVADRSHDRWRARLASVGQAQSVVELRIGDASGQPVRPGEIGEIMVRGASVMPGYWRNEKASAETLRDGWLMTGDVGRLDADGYLTLQDRSKDMIISGGSNVYPREVEEVLLNHPDVSEASVIGRPHPDWGEEVVACIVGNTTADALDALCRANIARFKAPKAYVFLTELPKNNYGKVLKTELRTLVKKAGAGPD